MTQPDELSVNLDPYDYNCGYQVSCFEAEDASISANISGGNTNAIGEGYTFIWEELSDTDGDGENETSIIIVDPNDDLSLIHI